MNMDIWIYIYIPPHSNYYYCYCQYRTLYRTYITIYKNKRRSSHPSVCDDWTFPTTAIELFFFLLSSLSNRIELSRVNLFRSILSSLHQSIQMNQQHITIDIDVSIHPSFCFLLSSFLFRTHVCQPSCRPHTQPDQVTYKSFQYLGRLGNNFIWSMILPSRPKTP